MMNDAATNNIQSPPNNDSMEGVNHGAPWVLVETLDEAPRNLYTDAEISNEQEERAKKWPELGKHPRGTPPSTESELTPKRPKSFDENWHLEPSESMAWDEEMVNNQVQVNLHDTLPPTYTDFEWNNSRDKVD